MLIWGAQCGEVGPGAERRRMDQPRPFPAEALLCFPNLGAERSSSPCLRMSIWSFTRSGEQAEQAGVGGVQAAPKARAGSQRSGHAC